MSIASELQDKINAKAAIKAAIEAKGVTVGDVKLNQYAAKIDEIEQGGGDPSIPVGTGQHLVTFYDFDGKVLKRQRVNTGEDATAPAIPTHQYLTFAEWNNPFTNVQSDIDTGAIYNTTDGKTYLFITLTPVTGLAPTLYFSKSSTSLMTIDWGDGTTSTSTTSGNQTIKHTYATAGDYIITVDNSQGGTWTMKGEQTLFYTHPTSLTKIYVGNYGLFGVFNFNTVYLSLKEISLGTFHNNANVCFGLSSIRHINVGKISTELGQYENMPVLAKLIEKKGQTSYAVNTNNKSIVKRIIPSTVNLIPTFASVGCTSIIEYIFLSTTPPTLANINAFTGINPICKIYVPDASVEAYKAATNWNNYSAYITPLSLKPQSDE